METPILSNKIRVCFVLDFWRGRAGAELQLALLLRYIDRSKIEPFVLTLHGNDEAIPEIPDCPVFCLKMGWLQSFSAFADAWRLWRFFRRNKFDIVQALTIDNSLLAFVAAIGRLSGVKKIFGFRVDLGFWADAKQDSIGKFAHKYLIDKVSANAEACKKSIIDRENAKPENIFVVPNLIETERFASIPSWTPANAHNPRRVGIVGNLKPVKGTDVFIDAAKIVAETHPSVQFELVGAGVGSDGAKQYQSQIRKLGSSQIVRLLGSLSDVPTFLSTLDIAVLSSRSEGLPNAIMEYMAAGRPCVVTDVGGCNELIQHKRNGLLVPAEDPAALAKGIIYLLDHPEEAELFASRARRDISEKYEAAVLVTRWHEIYENVLTGNKQ
jgi:glycosyltransferase involved in cell wall biosynthesis